MVLLLAAGLTSVAQAQIPAFPGAEGFGAYAQGGRGGDVYYVTNTNDDGAGSLRYGIKNASGPRTIVFAVSGVIQLQSRLKVNKDYITIAGQTAPGDGICLRDYSFIISADHVIVRYIRSRLGDEAFQESDSISIPNGNNIIMDHCSASWSVDETFSCSDDADNVTVQWSIISEALRNSVHSKGAHSYCALIRGHHGAAYTYHHNLFAHANSRMPRPGNYLSYIEDPEGLLFDFRNNVIYNWKGSRGGYNGDDDSVSKYNFINNYYKAGPNSSSIGNCYAFNEGCDYAREYFDGNVLEGSSKTGWDLVEGENADNRLANPLDVAYVTTESAEDAYTSVLDHVGASLVRDSVDMRIINDVINGTGAIIDDEDEVGGWPVYNTYNVPTDTDLDGMSDDWEIDNGLDPEDPDDRNYDRNGDGYTNLEEYLNWLALGQPDGNQPPVVELGDDLVAWLGMSGTPDEETIDLIPVEVSDDGLPYQTLTVTWTQVANGAPNATINPVDQEATSVTVTAAGVYEFMLIANDGAKETPDTVQVFVGTDPCEASHMSTGDPYNAADENEDCIVDLWDLMAIIVDNWLDCSNTLTNCGN